MAEPEPTDIPLAKPEETIAFFKAKGLAKSFAWQDILHAQHDHFFTVAKMMQRSLLETTHALLLDGIERGESAQQIARELKKRLMAAGWWGKAEMTDPLTGERSLVQLGSNRRVRTIVNTNLRTSYAAGRYERQQRTKAALPILVYKSLKDGRERAQHRAWHDVALPHDDPWWDTHYPPCDWGCRCRTVSMTEGQAKRRGIVVTEKPPSFPKRKSVNKRTGEVFEIEKGIGAGWDYHPGKSPLQGLAPEPLFPYSTREDGEEGALASAVKSAVDAFLDVFEFGEAGGVFIDVAGWPLPITKGWLKGLSTAAQRKAVVAARTIANPDSISAVWIRGKDGQAMLVRRYLAKAARGFTIVDVGNAYWSFGRIAEPPATGTRLWPSPDTSD